MLAMNTQDIQAQVQELPSIRRFAWRCRRGMLELDLLFKSFVKTDLPLLNEAELNALDGLLDLPDNELWLLLTDFEHIESESIKSVLLRLSSAEAIQ
jgi:antitoxin CptB